MQQSDVVEYPYAWDPGQEQLIHIDDALNGRQGEYICPDPDCKAAMVACQGKVREWYFRHKSAKGCRYLHDSIVLLLNKIVNAAIEGCQHDLYGQFTCECEQSTTIDLLVWDGKVVLNVAMDKRSVPGVSIRPDLNLLGVSGPLAFIEVVDTHTPEQQVIDTGVPILEIHVSHALLHELREKKVKVLEFKKCHNSPCTHRTKKRNPSRHFLTPDPMSLPYSKTAEWKRHPSIKNIVMQWDCPARSCYCPDGICAAKELNPTYPNSYKIKVIQFVGWDDTPHDVNCYRCGAALRTDTYMKINALCAECA